MEKFSGIWYLKIILGFLFTIIISYNFYVANNLRYETEGDAANFIELGLSLAKFHKYGNIKTSSLCLMAAFKEKKVTDQNLCFAGHSTWRPPMWPIIIAGIFVIFGYHLEYILIFKFLLHFLGIYIFYRTLKYLELRIALIVVGVFLYGVSPAWQLYSRVFLSEPITLFFITFWLYFLIRYIKTTFSFLPQAIIGGILILSHPYYLFLPFSVWLLLLINKQLSLRIFIFSSVICSCIVSIWIIRNFIVLETSKIVLTTSSGVVMAKGWNKEVPTKHTNTKGDLADETLVLKNYKYKNSTRNEVEKMELYRNATLDFISSNPDMILPIIGRKLLSAFNPFPETSRPGLLETARWLLQLLALLCTIYIILFSRNKLITSLAIALVLSTIGITILTYSGFRFRMPQTGLELIFVFVVAEEILRRRKIIK